MLSIIVVVGKNNEIGCDNQLLWKLPKDMKRFQQITDGKMVVMGEKTFLSIGRPLKNRRNVVATLDKNFSAEGVEIVFDLMKELKKWQESEEEVFIIGGATIYRLALPWVQRLYLTKIDDAPKADTFFPDYSEFGRAKKKEVGLDNGYKYEFLILEREKE